jgi:hypothetical protein
MCKNKYEKVVCPGSPPSYAGFVLINNFILSIKVVCVGMENLCFYTFMLKSVKISMKR